MDQNLEILSNYFGGGSAEEETDILNQIFVKNKDFRLIVMPRPRTIRLLVGSKGSGKSAILQYWKSVCDNNNIPSIILTPTQVNVQSGEDQDNRQYTQNIYKALVEEIAIKVGTELSGFLTDEQKRLVDDAVKVGARAPTGIDRLLGVLKPVGRAVTSIDFDEIIPHSSGEVKGRINTLNSYFGSKSDTLFYVLFDDIDQFGNAGYSSYLDRIWCSIIAFRQVAQQLPNVRIIVTLRNEIWRQICNRDNDGRDQIDHVRGWVVNLAPSETDMSRILRRRLARCKEHVEYLYGQKYEDVYQPFFEGKRCKLPSSNAERSWESYILKSSRDRPRDSVQLIDLMAHDAMSHLNNRICNRNVDNTSYQYSEQRVKDLCSENRDLCPDLEAVIISFASIHSDHSVDFLLDADTIRKHLLFLPGKRIYIQGKPLRPENVDDMYRLWALLFQLGFINVRIADSDSVDGYRHIEYGDDQTLVSESKWNEMQRVQWEIHPCYRSFLLHEAKKQKDMKTQKMREKRLQGDSESDNGVRTTKRKRPRAKKRRRK